MEVLHSDSSATLSCGGKHVAMSVYNKEAMRNYVRLYAFPEGKLLWSERLGGRGVFFPKGCSWLVGGSAERLKNATRYRVVKIDFVTGTVPKEWTLEKPRMSGKCHYGRLNALGASSDSI